MIRSQNSVIMNKGESCVETPAAPEWLSKLESRREKLTRGKLGHEAGAGAPCNECGDKCPGLDLHFWRKVCRNCKCRKDQHKCADDDLSGWAQFEILGQIRSKPAYIKIKAFADQPVKVEWVPPNVTPDVISDYMDTFESTQIPVAGSDAAAKRKQQLEFQVPPHDLDAELCDNLTESEAAQLQQYVKKIRENCVGQGNVVRVGNVMHGVVGKTGNAIFDSSSEMQAKPSPIDVIKHLSSTPTKVIKDKVIANLLNSEVLVRALAAEHSLPLPSKMVAFSQPLKPDFAGAVQLSPEYRKQLTNLGLNKAMVQSLVENGPFYDSLLSDLKRKRIDFSNDPILVPIDKFRKEYIDNPKFQKDIEDFVEFLNKIDPQYSTPIKSKPITSDAFNSPLPLRNPIQTKMGSIMKQDTPMRRIKFGGVTVAYDLGLPIDAAIEKDKIISFIINSETLQNALHSSSNIPSRKNVILTDVPMTPDFEDNSGLSVSTKKKLEDIGMNTSAVQSGVINGPVYDKLLDGLKARGINYGDCLLLAPMDEFRNEFLKNVPFQREVARFVEAIPNDFAVATSDLVPGIYHPSKQLSPDYRNKIDNQGFLSNPQSPFKSNLHGSGSTDSGFDSKPPTPNYSTFPGILPDENKDSANASLLGLNAHPGKFTSIPGIEELNMYSEVEPSPKNISNAIAGVNRSLDNLRISPTPSGRHSPVAVLKCKECKKDIMSGEVAVKAERAGKEVAWHPQCFVCHKCNELLADLVYFFHGGNVYCGRDLAIILKIPRCKACDELIFTKEYTAAEGATFHIKHFCCYHCDTPLAGHQYVPDEKTNMPVCLKCYDEHYAESCNFCKQPIGPAEQGVAWGTVHWHGQCFICMGTGCGKSLLGGRFCVKNNMPFCCAQCVASVIRPN